MIETPDMDRLQKVVDGLMEHFDTVQVFVTRHEHEREGTVNANLGEGNWFARYGQVCEWATKQNERTRDNVRREDA